MDYSADYNTVTECNFPSQNAILVWLSGYETVDRNYWGDYLARYPNASEIDHSGVGNTPYVFNMPNSGTKVFEDTQPLMNPVIIPLMGSSTTQTNVPEFSSLLMAIPLILLLFAVAVIVRRRKALT